VAEIVLGDTYLPYKLCRCVFFLLRMEIVFGCTREKGLGVTSLPTMPVVPLCQFFWLRGEIVFGYSVSKKDSYLVSLIERQTTSKCVYFVKSNTLLLCVSLLSIYLLYQKDH
jgi:hypothetical protein